MCTTDVESPGTSIAEFSSLNLLERSLPKSNRFAPSEDRLDLLLHFATASAARIEELRRTQPQARAFVYLHLRLSVAWLRTPHAPPIDEQGNNLTSRWLQPAGQLTEILPFSSAASRPIIIQIDASEWIGNILPGLGSDSLMLVEVRLPDTDLGGSELKNQLEKAKTALSELKFEDVLTHCRGAQRILEKSLGATKARTLTAGLRHSINSGRPWPL
jgi:hypothetical protein